MTDLNTPLKLSGNNTSDVQFSEVQKFGQSWIRVLFGVVFGLLLFTCVYQLIYQAYIFSFAALALMGLLLTLLLLFIRKAHLHTKINNAGVSYRFFPFQLTYRHIAWEQIEEIYVREFDALIEYGGWGARYSSRGNAYIISGRYGLQMELVDERNILISTHRPIELERIILQLAYNYEVK